MCRWMRLAPAVGLMVVGVGTAPAADTLESAEAAIVALCQKIHAVQFKIESTQNVETPTYKAISHTQGTFELLKKGDKPLYRMETHTRASRIEKGKEEKYEATTTTVGDGEFQWAFTTEQPTEPGWYWAMERGEIRMYRFDGKYVNDGNDGETSFDLEAARENWEITHWLGPLPLPHPPG